VKKALMVLFADLNSGVVKSQAVVHAREMADLGIVDFEIWCFTHSKTMLKNQQAALDEIQSLSGCKIRLFRAIKPAIPFSILINAILLWLKIREIKPVFEIIHARGEFATAVCAYLKPFMRFTLIRDSRGDSVTEYIYRRYAVMGRAARLVHSVFKWHHIATMRYTAHIANIGCDKSMFVTEELKNRIGKTLGKKPFWIIPSSASGKIFYFDEAIREKKRMELGYSGDNKVIVYSGILRIYRIFPECVALFDRLYRSDRNFRFLVLTPDVDYACDTLRLLPEGSYKLMAVKFDDVNSYLNAADFAMMILEHNPSNQVSSPVKFAEYSLAGLPVIMSDSVPDSYAIAERNGNLCDYKNGVVSFPTVYDRKDVARRYKSVISKSSLMQKYREVYGD
jgi:hypothetical protein